MTSSSSTTEKSPVVKVGDFIENKYQVMKILGQGGFGAVYEVRENESSELYALKLEMKLPKPNEPGLDLEAGVLKRLRRSSHVTRYIAHGKIDKFNFLVMQLVGTNLATLRRATPDYRFTLSTSLRLAVQCLECLEDTHRWGLLHRDVKPSNFAMGRTIEDLRNVYILDFGLVRRYRLKNGKIRPARQVCGFRGTSKYASLNCHDGRDLGRVDDLWSWLYMIVEFQSGGLPWRCETDREKIRQIKIDRKRKLYQKLEPENLQISINLNTLKYADDPPYHWYKQKLNQAMQRNNCQMSDPFDWEINGVYYEQMKNICPKPAKIQSKILLKDASKGEDSAIEIEMLDADNKN